MNLIVAVDNNWAVGYRGGLLTYLPGDLPYFKEKTMGKVVIMGRKTLESLPKGKPLKGRKNVILTRDSNYRCENAVVCNNKDEIIEYIGQFQSEDVYVIGGAQIYNLFMNECNKAYVTKIYSQLPADKYINNMDKLENWEITWKSDMNEHEGIEYQWILYENKEI